MNIELLKKVKARILEEPRRFNLNLWGGVIDPKEYEMMGEIDDAYLDEDAANNTEDVLRFQRPPCGAVGCIAGNCLIESGYIKPRLHFDGDTVYEMPDDTLELAAAELGIGGRAAQRLFFLKSWYHHDEFGNKVGWPQEFEDELNQHLPGTLEYAEVTGRRIDFFIATDGTDEE